MTDPHDDRSPNERDHRDGEIVYRSVHDRMSGELLSSTVSNTIAGVEDAVPEDLPPLYESIDPDALDELFSPTANGGRRADGHVSFPFEDYHVTIHTHGEIAVVSISESRRSLSISGGGGGRYRLLQIRAPRARPDGRTERCSSERRMGDPNLIRGTAGLGRPNHGSRPAA